MPNQMNKLFKQIAREQYSQIVNSAIAVLNIRQPKEGWIKTVRMALGMSGTQLANRLRNTRTITPYLERSELEGGITIRKMQQVAEAMDCKFVYAIVPEESVESLVNQQAFKKAQALTSQASVHMMLEDQALTEEQLAIETQRLKGQMLKNMDRTFWDEI